MRGKRGTVYGIVSQRYSGGKRQQEKNRKAARRGEEGPGLLSARGTYRYGEGGNLTGIGYRYLHCLTIE